MRGEDRLDGNRLTNKGTVAFRGEKRSTLLDFGSQFDLEEYKDGIWKLIPVTITENDLSKEIEDMEALNDSVIDSEIEALTASNVDDDLPF